ncbi:MAG: alpha-amylase family protein [Terracidiphilus sp.]
MISRRNFIKTSLTSGAAAVPLSSALRGLEAQSAASHAENSRPGSGQALGALAALPQRAPAAEPSTLPWQMRVRRVGQTNMTEHDPAVMNIEEWADLWYSAQADIVFISVTGILAFYPSKVPFHKHGKFLNGRDFFGECVTAARKRGMRVVARMSPDLNWLDALEAHPEWAMRHRDGSVQFNEQEPRLFKTCMFSRYMDEYVPAIMREINSLYDVDCFYTNGWPPLGSLPDCHCAICSKLPASGTPAYWRVFTDRVLELWGTYDAIAKEKKRDSFFFANSGGNVRGGPNLDRVGKMAAWFQADNQGRTWEEPEVWGCSLQGRVCSAVMDGGFAANVTAAYSTGSPGWRNLSKSPDETRMWLNQTLASGMTPYLHFVGAEGGEGEDTRWQQVGRDYFRWTAKHDAHFVNRRSIADIGVVIGQSTQLLYPGPATARTRHYMRETTQGIYDALLWGRYAFDFVHEDRLQPERIARYRALILPNVAMLSDEQCRQLRDYERAGGALLGSFETSLYDENLKPRADFGLADVFGIGKAGDAVGTNGNPYYAWIEEAGAQPAHEVLAGFAGTHWLPGAENRIPLQPIGDPLLTVVPGFVRYPPELAYPPVPHTSEPAIVLRNYGVGRTAWFSGDVERTYWLTGHDDLLRLIHNTLRWLTQNQRMVTVEGDGFVEMSCWETAPGYAVHLLNYTNPNAHHGWMQSVTKLGPQRVAMKLPASVRAKKVELLRAEIAVPFEAHEQELRFTIPVVDDYEVAAITVA